METTLYDTTGRPRAYIADESEPVIYTWSGRAVAYLDGDVLYGWRGKHLGWFVDGILYDLQGQRVGFIRSQCPVVTYIESVKNVKYMKYTKSLRSSPSPRLSLAARNSGWELEAFVSQNAPG